MVSSGARRARVLRLATAGPQDTAPLAAAIDRGEIDPATIVAIVGKTEGNGCVNDFTRGYATLALKLLLAERAGCPLAEVEKRVAIVMSGGTEGGLSPHLLVFCREEGTAAPSAPRLAIGVGLTRAVQAGGDRSCGADRGDGCGREPCDEGRWHRLGCRRPFRADQMPAAHQGAYRGGSAARREDRDRGHLSFDGRVARRLGTRRRAGAGRDRGRTRGGDLQGLVALLQCRQHLRRRRAAAQRDRRAGQLGGLGRRPDDRPRRHEGRDRRRGRAPRAGRDRRRDRRRARQGRGRADRRDPRPAPHHARRQRHPFHPPRPRPGRRRAGRRDRRHDALRLRRRRAPGPAGGGPVAIIGRVPAAPAES